MLLDTSGLLHFLDRKSPEHSHARDFISAADVWLTHDLVLAELIALAPRRGLPRKIVFEFLDELQGSPILDLVFVNAEIHELAMDLLRQRLDKDWSLCDAVSFVLMREYGIEDALTSDHHFEQAGFRRLLQP